MAIPNHLKPFSIVNDDELAQLRRAAVLAGSFARHLLKDTQTCGFNADNGNEFTRQDLVEIAKFK